MIRINVFAQATQENLTKAIDVAQTLAVTSQQEKGCIAYDVFTSVTRPDVFMICETWADDAALQAHRETAHYVKYVPELKALAQTKTELFNF